MFINLLHITDIFIFSDQAFIDPNQCSKIVSVPDQKSDLL